jgi:hypothetical protein
LFALDSSIGYLANLLAVKMHPLFVVEEFVELRDENRVYEVYKGIAHIALVL